jgi:hypothetical protein
MKNQILNSIFVSLFLSQQAFAGREPSEFLRAPTPVNEACSATENYFKKIIGKAFIQEEADTVQEWIYDFFLAIEEGDIELLSERLEELKLCDDHNYHLLVATGAQMAGELGRQEHLDVLMRIARDDGASAAHFDYSAAQGSKLTQYLDREKERDADSSSWSLASVNSQGLLRFALGVFVVVAICNIPTAAAFSPLQMCAADQKPKWAGDAQCLNYHVKGPDFFCFQSYEPSNATFQNISVGGLTTACSSALSGGGNETFSVSLLHPTPNLEPGFDLPSFQEHISGEIEPCSMRLFGDAENPKFMVARGCSIGLPNEEAQIDYKTLQDAAAQWPEESRVLCDDKAMELCRMAKVFFKGVVKWDFMQCGKNDGHFCSHGDMFYHQNICDKYGVCDGFRSYAGNAELTASLSARVGAVMVAGSTLFFFGKALKDLAVNRARITSERVETHIMRTLRDLLLFNARQTVRASFGFALAVLGGQGSVFLSYTSPQLHALIPWRWSVFCTGALLAAFVNDRLLERLSRNSEAIINRDFRKVYCPRPLASNPAHIYGNDEKTCAVCLDEFALLLRLGPHRRVTLPCGHANLHARCALTVFQQAQVNHVTPACPVCREPFGY